MWRAIGRTAAGQVFSRPLQSTLLLLVVALAAATMTIALVLGDQAGAPYDRVMRDTNGAHAWLYAADRSALEAPASQHGVTGIAGPFPRTRVTTVHANESADLSLWGMPATPPEVGRPLLTAGRWISSQDEAVVEAGLARAWGLRPGDTVNVRGTGGDATLRVVGVAILQQRAPYPIWGPGNVIVPPETVQLLSIALPSWEVGLRLADPNGVGRLLPPPGNGPAPVLVTDWRDARESVAEQLDVTIIFFRVFGVFAIGAVGLIVANMVGSQVLAQLRDVGVLKAIGLTPWQVSAVFLAAQLGVTTAATVAGSLLGFLLAPLLVRDVAGVLSPPTILAFSPGRFALVLAAMSGVAAVCTAFPAWHAGRLPATRALARGRSIPVAPARLTRLALALRLPPMFALGLKDAFARPVRAWFTIAAVALAVASAAMTMTIESTLAAARGDPGLFGNEPYHVALYFPSGANMTGLDAGVAALPGVALVVRERTAWATVPALGRPFHLTGLSVAPGDIRQVTAGRSPRAPGEVLVTERMARRLDLALGDRLPVTLGVFAQGPMPSLRPIGGADLLVTGMFRDTDDDGLTAYTTIDTLPAGQTPLPAAWGIRLADTSRSVEIAAALRALGGQDATVVDEVARNRQDIDQTAKDARPVLFGLDALLIFIAAVNVLATLLFSVRERYRDLGVLRAVGLTPRQISVAVTSGAAVLALIAAAAGIPAGLYVSDVLFDFFGREEGWREGVASFPATWQLMLLVPLAVAVALIGAWLPARHAARLNVTDALRAE